MDVKERVSRFRAWQRKPFNYVNKSVGTTTCANCGTEFNDNYCPRCGQRAGTGRITWKSVREGVLLIWGMESRSLSYTLLQLLLRPGRLVSDYLSGKRQVSFPPVKMLLLVAIGYVIIASVKNKFFPEDVVIVDTGLKALDAYINWTELNPGWGVLLLSSLLILPTWILYRHSPRHTHHSLPEGFFIQVFMSTLMMLTSIASLFFTDWVNWVVLIYYFIVYKQVFGYNFWGTLWRYLLCFFVGYLMMIFILYLSEILISGHAVDKKTMMQEIVLLSSNLGIAIVVCIIGFFIGRYTAKRRLAKETVEVAASASGECEG